MAPSTPPPSNLRPHTPPTPLHGPQFDTWEPYSPRRSKRSTAQTNPYGSFNADRSPKSHLHQRNTTPPPTTGKRARFLSAQLSSPPSSPTSPVKRSSPRKTPSSRVTNGAHSDSDNPFATSAPTPASAMFPTPNKTPTHKKRAAPLHGTARILNFQPHSPNDVMPTPRKIKSKRGASHGFDLYDEGAPQNAKQGNIEVYTDSNARVPTMDGADDNPFIGERKPAVPRRSRKAKSDEEREMEAMAARNEGIIYVFRGKKVFRRFEDSDTTADNLHTSSATAADEPDYARHQRSLRRQAGDAAQRLLTRSAIQPRLLFQTSPEPEPASNTVDREIKRLQALQRQRRGQSATDDEEAPTDIETEEPQPVPQRAGEATPRKSDTAAAAAGAAAAHLATPPSTKRGKRTVDRSAAIAVPLESIDEEGTGSDVGGGESEDVLPASPAPRKTGRAKPRSPFDQWARVKSRKRGADAVEEGEAGAKRARRSGYVSPA